MTRVLLVDDAATVNELFADAMRARLGVEVTTVSTIAELPEVLARSAPFDLALVDLSFPQEHRTGIDALVLIHRTSPATTLALITQGDDWVAETLRDAWDLFPLATVVAKSAPVSFQLELIQRVLAEGTAPVDPAVQPLLPATRSTTRTLESFGRLVQHVGHAKLWSALLRADDPSYRSLSELTGLRMNTLKNYRAQLLPELALHGLDDPNMREMQEFALRSRALLAPYLDGGSGP